MSADFKSQDFGIRNRYPQEEVENSQPSNGKVISQQKKNEGLIWSICTRALCCLCHAYQRRQARLELQRVEINQFKNDYNEMQTLSSIIASKHISWGPADLRKALTTLKISQGSANLPREAFLKFKELFLKLTSEKQEYIVDPQVDDVMNEYLIRNNDLNDEEIEEFGKKLNFKLIDIYVCVRTAQTYGLSIGIDSANRYKINPSIIEMLSQS